MRVCRSGYSFSGRFFFNVIYAFEGPLAWPLSFILYSGIAQKIAHRALFSAPTFMLNNDIGQVESANENPTSLHQFIMGRQVMDIKTDMRK
jgi:hypothetical protein